MAKGTYGNYEFALSLSSILLILGSAGLQHVVMYRLSRLDAPPETLTGHKLAGRLFRYSLLTSAFICLMIIILSPVFVESSKSFWIIGLSLLIPIKALHGIYNAWYKARQLIAESIVYSQMLPAIGKVTFLLATWLLWPNVYAVVSAIILSELVPLLIRYVKKPLNIFESSGESRLTTWDFKYAGQLAVTTGVSKTVKYADVLMMGLLSTSLATAEYVIASKLALTLTIAHGINNKIITPRIGKFHGENDSQSIFKEYHQSRILTLSFSFLGAIVFSVFGSYILSIFGDYQKSYSTLMILCATYVIHVSFGMSGGYLNIAGYSNLTLLTTIMVLVINVVINYLLIPVLGADGAAIAMLISFTVTNITTAILILHKDDLKTYSMQLAVFTISFVAILLLNAFSVLDKFVSFLILISILVSFIIAKRKFVANLFGYTQKYLSNT